VKRSALPLLLFFGLASPAWAVKEWYDYYGNAVKLVRADRCPEALKELQQAIELKPTPGEQQRTYGMTFIDYFPYYQQGLCYMKQGDFSGAVRLFNVELSYKQIQKELELYRDLLKLKNEAETGEHQRVARRAREDVNRWLKEATDLEKAKKYPEALARLAEAEQAASALDSQTQHYIADLKDHVREAESASIEAANRARRIDQSLSEGKRLLEEGKDTEAAVRFAEVLLVDPHHPGALEGKREADHRIIEGRTNESLRSSFEQGKALLNAGRYEEALPLLTDASLDRTNIEARPLLEKAQSTVEGMRRQKELSRRVTELLDAGERLLHEKKYPEAQVRFESVLAIDPGNVKASERRSVAERLTGDVLYERWMPPQAPMLTFFEPKPNLTETSEPTVPVVGVASDDRSVARLDFTVNGHLVAQEPTRSLLDNSGADRQVQFQRALMLQPGVNEITVTAVDGQGLQKSQTFHITRRRRLHEQPWFLPAGFLTSVGLVGLGFVAQRLRQRRALRRRFNPYIAGAPVLDETMFFGREKLLTRILNVLHHNSLMITGERRIGKTTLLYHLKRALEVDEGTDYRFFPVFTDLQGVPETAFFHTVMSDVVDGLALTPETLSSLRFRAGAQDYDGRDFSHDLQRVVEELKHRTPKRVKLALLIDEVDVLNSYSERINQRLRSIFMKTFSEQLVAIMSGVGVKRTWNSEGSPWYNFFDEIEVTPFGREEAEALIREPVQGFFRYEPEAVEAILKASGGKPYLIQRLCIHAVNRMLEEGRTRMSALDVKTAIDMDRTFSFEPGERVASGNGNTSEAEFTSAERVGGQGGAAQRPPAR
jgi:tetratricopeptide (TPR) repeat protein